MTLPNLRFLSPFRAYLISPFLVALTTWILLLIQSSIAHAEGGHVRPFGVGFLLSVALVTALGGRGPGLLTLTLSCLSLMLILTPLGTGGSFGRPRDWTELFLLLAVGAFLIRGLEALRTNARLLAESEEARARLRAVMDIAPVGVLLSDKSGRLTYANREAERIWGHSLETLLQPGAARSRLLNADGTPALPGQTGLARALAGDVSVVQEERIIEQPGGTQFFVQTSATLVRDEAGRVRSGLVVFFDITERKQAEQRDRAIALALQDALIPPLPKRVPGLEMASYYKAALAEASVGGDFIDVFALENGRVVFAVGDLSGKGLAAASQVATVRNMLRYSLYRIARLDDAIAELNNTVVAHELLTGFATLFIGVYDPATRDLVYLSCGHDPGLVRRGESRAIELLPPNGDDISPVLGLVEDGRFVQRSVTLMPGDTLFFCTDGVTEAGRSRGEFLGVAGVARLLGEGLPDESVEELVARVVSEVRDYAQGIQHDDVCLLAAVVAA